MPYQPRNGRRHRRRRSALLIAGFLLLSAGAAFAQSPAPSAQSKLRVKTESAAVRLRPEAAAPVIAVLKRGTVLMSYETENGWYRVVPASDADPVRFVGYLAADDAEVLEIKTASTPNFWADEESAFQDKGVELLLSGGYGAFAGGDLSAGVDGLFDELESRMAALGRPPVREMRHPFNGGLQLSVGVFYRFSARLAAGLWGEYGLAQRFDTFTFMEDPRELGANSTPVLKTFGLRPGLRYTVLSSKTASLFLTAGAAVYFASFHYNRTASWGFIKDQGTVNDYSHTLDASRTVPGAFAGLESEIRLTDRAAILLQAIYRFAKAAGWEGTESTRAWVDDRDASSGPVSGRTLRLVTRDGFRVLTVPAADAAPEGADAALDFSGLSLGLGLRIRF